MKSKQEEMKFLIFIFLFMTVHVTSFHSVHQELVKNHVDFFKKDGNFSMMESSVTINNFFYGLQSYQFLHNMSRGVHNLFFMNHWQTIHTKELSKKKFQIDWNYQSFSKILFPFFMLQMKGSSIYTHDYKKINHHDIQNVFMKLKIMDCEKQEDCPFTMSCCEGTIYNYCCDQQNYHHPLQKVPVPVKNE